jgi:hypothetical protein
MGVDSKEKRYLEEVGIDGFVELKWVMELENMGCGLDSDGSGQGQLAEYCEDNEVLVP